VNKKETEKLITNKFEKLHLGAEENYLQGWINTDIKPLSKKIHYLDATKHFPFKDKSFKYVFSEHFIEHLSFHEGLFMLKECHRVLKNGGKIRIATPDLSVFLGLGDGNLSAPQKKYIKWINERFQLNISSNKNIHVINNLFYNWGHKFIYDGSTLVNSLKTAGFHKIVRCQVGKSLDPNLNNIEQHGIHMNAPEANKFETMVFEATCKKKGNKNEFC